MKLREYLTELKKYSLKTKEDKTSHTHDVEVDADGNGRTTKTNSETGRGKTIEDHTHKIFEWNVQPNRGHIHSIKTDKK